MCDEPLFNVPKGEYIFRETGDRSLWTCVSHDLWDGLTLSDVLNLLDITIDVDCQFCRVIRYDGYDRVTFEYRHYNDAKIRININRSHV